MKPRVSTPANRPTEQRRKPETNIEGPTSERLSLGTILCCWIQHSKEKRPDQKKFPAPGGDGKSLKNPRLSTRQDIIIGSSENRNVVGFQRNRETGNFVRRLDVTIDRGSV